MREVKFRAWDNKNHKMFIPTMLEYKNDDETFSGEIRDVWIWRKPYFDERVYWNGTCMGTEESILMQYTGLKDKNGKEIYEGDILEENAGYYFEVVWEEKYAKFKLQWRNKAYQYPEWNRGINMQVIGNIYDNPELLQEVSNE